MSRKVLLVSLLSAFIVGCGSGRSSIDSVASSNGSASISGETIVGQTLSASVSDPDGVEAGTDTYQWYSNGAAINGATSTTYTLTADEGGETVSVVARYTDSEGLRETVESSGSPFKRRLRWVQPSFTRWSTERLATFLPWGPRGWQVARFHLA